MKTYEQEMAKLAYDCVVKVKNEKFKNDYKSLVRRLPAMISNNGLLTTVAFLKSKGKDQHKAVLDHLSKWLIRDNKEDLLEFLLDSEFSNYMYYTKQAIKFSIWLKRIAEGEIEEKGDGKDES